MKGKISVLAVVGFTGILSGCESLPTTSSQQLDQLKAANQARIIAPTATFLAGFDIGTHFNLGMNSVDGASVRSGWSGDKDDLTLSAGKHELGVDCNYVGAEPVVGQSVTMTPIDVTLESGHIYRLKAVAGDMKTCKAGIDDITAQVAAGTKQ